jgi:Fe-S-cluster-containing dehydrogenase component
MSKKEKSNKSFSRRNFLKLGLGIGGAAIAGSALKGLIPVSGDEKIIDSSGKIKLLTADGKLVEVDRSLLEKSTLPSSGPESREGIPGRKFVMVIDLSKCKNARKCIEGCQKGHQLEADQEWIQVNLMKDNENSGPYWFPKPCYHCDNPPCVKVCPVGATFKRKDGLVLVDAERCIGCKFCVVACPYSVRIFNWKKIDIKQGNNQAYSPETSVPQQIGTVGKCDFCPDMSRKGELPHCAKACPMGAIYFGDMNEDVVTNGSETVRFKQLLTDRAGYRYLEELGTKPNVYYLPPVNRGFPFERGLNDLSEKDKDKFSNILGNSKNKK